jgi:hypothetical protein
MNEYRSASWLAFRNEVLRLDDYACTQCRKRRSDGAVLHVHHKRYLAGKRPWEYPHHLCATLCAGCHAAEHGIIPPKFGWEFIGHDDLGDLSGSCEYCGTEIRHVFLIHHTKWRAMEVGEICCDNLTCTETASGHMESLRKHLDRRKRFVSSPRWEKDYAGALSIKQKQIHLSLVPHEGAFRLRVYGKLGKKVFPTLLEAKANAFDLVESGVIGTWLQKQQQQRKR